MERTFININCVTMRVTNALILFCEATKDFDMPLSLDKIKKK